MLGVTLLLAACGGGGGGDSASAPPGTSGAARALTAVTGNDRTTALAAPTTNPLVVRARGSLVGGVGPLMTIRQAGREVARIEVRSTTFVDYSFTLSTLTPGTAVDIVFTNDAFINGEDRNLFVAYARQGTTTVLSTASGVSFDRGTGALAFDGRDVVPGTSELYVNGALRMRWPSPPVDPATLAAAQAASRFLQQATFGPTRAEVERLQRVTPATWINEQMALPLTPDFVNYFQTKLNQSAGHIPPNGSQYSPQWTSQAFWRTAVQAPDPLRKRVAFALAQIFTLSLADDNLYHHGRPYAHFLDTLNKHAFGNFRQLLEEVALSPAMGIYLTHIRNQKEDGNGRMPDENFARELMQLFSIGLVELNADGTPVLGASGQPVETYGNADVMAMARVFTGWSWGFDDAQMTANNFRWGGPSYSTTGTARIDLRPMKNYPAFHSSLEKKLFAGRPWALTIPANVSGPESLRLALDTLFKHPNVGPFIGRQMIQRLVTSNPGPAYVARVAQAFNNNGQGVRGDMRAVVRAVLLDIEARPAIPDVYFGKLREPTLRVAHFMRSFGAVSATAEYRLEWEFSELLQRPQHAPSVFGFFRPGYVPPNTTLADANRAAPEMQIVSESTVAAWVNRAEAMIGWGMGWTGSGPDVTATLAHEATLAAAGVDGLLNHLSVMLFGGRMSDRLRRQIVDAVASVPNSATRDRDRARIALFLAMSSSEYLVQR